MISIRHIDLNSDGMTRTIGGQRVHLQTRCSGGVLELWAWRGRKRGDAQIYVRGSSFFDGNAIANRAYLNEIVTCNLGL